MADSSFRVSRPSSPLYLPLGEGQTRVVIPIRSQNWEGVRLKLKTISFRQSDGVSLKAHKYSALSYTWGEIKTTFVPVADVNDEFHHVWITKSLIEALNSIFALTESSVELWVDQLSINQSSMSEKASQIAIMREIYESASQVLIWLGNASEDSSIALHKIVSVTNEYKIIKGDNETHPRNPRGWLPSEHIDSLVGPLGEKTTTEWQAVSNLLTRRWFSRAWILHEASSQNSEIPDSVLVLCGSQTISFANFTALCVLFHSLIVDDPRNNLTVLSPEAKWFLTNIVVFQDFRHVVEDTPFFTLLEMIRNFQALDPRDKIFCMLPFVTDNNDVENKFLPSYHSSYYATCIEIIIWYIRKYRCLDFIGYCEKYEKHSQIAVHGWKSETTEMYNNSILPSWVPDWRVGDIFSNIHNYYGEGKPLPVYKACGDQYLGCLEIRGEVADTRTLQALTVEGIRLCSIQIFDGSRIRSSYTLKLPKWRGNCPLNNIPILEVISRSLCMDYGEAYDPSRSENKYQKARGGCMQFSYITELDQVMHYEGVPHFPEAMRRLSRNSTLFTLGTSNDPVYGVGRNIVKAGDELWMLKGGKMLFALRPWLLPQRNQICNLNAIGDLNNPKGIVLDQDTVVYELIGECFVLGLMDGEILDMLGSNPIRIKPDCLADMDTVFQKIHLMDPESTRLEKKAKLEKGSQSKDLGGQENPRLGIADCDEIERIVNEARKSSTS